MARDSLIAAQEGHARPLRIVTTGDAQTNYSFTLEEENLAHVLSQVPENMKVSECCPLFGALAGCHVCDTRAASNTLHL
jgi:hypothetical protein